MAEQPTPKHPKTRTWIKIVLGASLAFNVLIVGAFAGAALRDGGPHGKWKGPRGGGAPHAQMRGAGTPLIAALERQDRREILKGLRAKGDRVMADQRPQMQELVAVLKADALDTEALQRLVTGQGQMMTDRLEALTSAWQAHIIEMPQEARLAYADRLEKIVQKRPRKSP